MNENIYNTFHRNNVVGSREKTFISMKYIRDSGSNPNSFHLPNSFFFPRLTRNVRWSQIFRDLDSFFETKNRWDNEAIFAKIVGGKM